MATWLTARHRGEPEPVKWSGITCAVGQRPIRRKRTDADQDHERSLCRCGFHPWRHTDLQRYFGRWRRLAGLAEFRLDTINVSTVVDNILSLGGGIRLRRCDAVGKSGANLVVGDSGASDRNHAQQLERRHHQPQLPQPANDRRSGGGLCCWREHCVTTRSKPSTLQDWLTASTSNWQPTRPHQLGADQCADGIPPPVRYGCAGW